MSISPPLLPHLQRSIPGSRHRWQQRLLVRVRRLGIGEGTVVVVDNGGVLRCVPCARDGGKVGSFCDPESC
jgi:hypothetical protein